MGLMRTGLVIAAVVLLAAGCQPNNRPRAGDPARAASIETGPAATTQPARPSNGGGGGGGGGTDRRRVEVMVRDANAAGMAGSIVGRTCRLQFRRDALGIAGNAAIAPTHDWGGRMSVEGKVLDLTDQWIIVAGAQGKRYYVPLMTLLLVEVQD